MDNCEEIGRHFASIGADWKVETVVRGDRYTIDVRATRRRGEQFVLGVTSRSPWEVGVLHVARDMRHLLMFVRDGGETHRYLCGHDERHWFVAAVPRADATATTVRKAMEALKPAEVKVAQQRACVRAKDRNRRHNGGFIRQGEWFFVPEAGLGFDPRVILHNEALQRGGSKPHVAQEVCRAGGETVYVCRHYPSGVGQRQYRQILGDNPAAAHWGWRPMLANAAVHARGKVRHPDHATVHLPIWHRVFPSTEAEARWLPRMVFLD